MVLARFPQQTTRISQWTRELSDTMRPFTTRTDDVNQIAIESAETAAYGAYFAIERRFDQRSKSTHSAARCSRREGSFV
jgi:hypothetical protein